MTEKLYQRRSLAAVNINCYVMFSALSNILRLCTLVSVVYIISNLVEYAIVGTLMNILPLVSTVLLLLPSMLELCVVFFS